MGFGSDGGIAGQHILGNIGNDDVLHDKTDADCIKFSVYEGFFLSAI